MQGGGGEGRGEEGVCRKGLGRWRIDIVEHKKPNCKAAYLSLISLTLRVLKVAKGLKGLLYFRVTQAFPKDILHIGSYLRKPGRNISYYF